MKILKKEIEEYDFSTNSHNITVVSLPYNSNEYRSEMKLNTRQNKPPSNKNKI